jgi:hypothetical protein
MNVRRLVQKDFADQGRRGNAEVFRLPTPTDFFRMSVNGKDADLSRSFPEEGGQTRRADSFAQRQSHRNPRKPKAEGNVVVDALQLELRRGPCEAQRNVVLQGMAHRTNAPGSGAQFEDHEGIPRVGRELGGKRTELVLVVCAERLAGLGRMNRVHISRRACARVITRTRAREAEDPPTSGGSLILALGFSGQKPAAALLVWPQSTEAITPVTSDTRPRLQGIAYGAVGFLAGGEADCFVFRREFAAPFPIPRLFGRREVGVDGSGVVEVVGV